MALGFGVCQHLKYSHSVKPFVGGLRIRGVIVSERVSECRTVLNRLVKPVALNGGNTAPLQSALEIPGNIFQMSLNWVESGM